jgi:GNAT superfamily N-acetyltransferase
MESPDSLEIRNAVVDDAPALAALLAELDFPASAEAIAERLDRMLAAGEPILVAVRSDAVLGLLTTHVTTVLHRPTPVGRITALIVTERARGQGIGRALIMAAERMFAARGCALVEVTSNRKWTEAHKFYERLGYQPTSVRFGKVLSPTATSEETRTGPRASD